MHRFNLAGKVGIVTGGNGGIGKGIARGLLECGATLVVAGRNKAKCDAALVDLGTIGPPVSAFVMDVTVEAECKTVVAETVKRHGRLDILVNNAGGGANTGVPPSPPDEMAVEGFRKIIDANLTSTFMLSHLLTIERWRFRQPRIGSGSGATSTSQPRKIGGSSAVSMYSGFTSTLPGASGMNVVSMWSGCGQRLFTSWMRKPGPR